MASYLYVVRMRVGRQRRALFEEVYDEHMSALVSVPGVEGALRGWSVAGKARIGGEEVTVPAPDDGEHVAIYSIANPETLTGREWEEAVERGRWATTVRPYTEDRHHTLIKVESEFRQKQ